MGGSGEGSANEGREDKKGRRNELRGKIENRNRDGVKVVGVV
jgi:hypothetical protein